MRFVKAEASLPKYCTGRRGSTVSGVSTPISRTRSLPFRMIVSPSTTRRTVRQGALSALDWFGLCFRRASRALRPWKRRTGLREAPGDSGRLPACGRGDSRASRGRRRVLRGRPAGRTRLGGLRFLGRRFSLECLWILPVVVGGEVCKKPVDPWDIFRIERLFVFGSA